jgi:hypothetical protein
MILTRFASVPFLLAALTSGSQGFDAPPVLSAGSASSLQTVIDVNHDGALDVIAAGNDISVILGNGDGTFRTPRTMPAFASAFAVGDFNGDGREDILTGTDTPAFYAGNGDGTFRPSIVANSTHVEYGFATADFNGDGKLDAASTTANGDKLVVLTGRGDGTFDATSYPTGQLPFAIVHGDFNNDRHPDLAVVAFQSKSIQLFLSNGNGTFAAAKDIAATANFALAAGDINGDGFSDLAFGSADGKSVAVLFGKADGSFTQVSVPLPGDMTNDLSIQRAITGNELIVTSIVNGAAIRLIYQWTGGVFVERTRSFNPRVPLFGDFDGDGVPDSLGFSSDWQTFTFSKGLGNGVFRDIVAFQGEFRSNADENNGHAIDAADFNRDGIADLAISNRNDTVTIAFGNGVGFSLAGSYALPLASLIRAADVNGDGAPDVIAVHNSTKTVSTLLNDGHGRLGAAVMTSIPDTTTLRDMRTGDFNRDGRADLLINMSGGAYVALSRGDATYAAPKLVAGGSTIFTSEIGDFDGDGMLDIVFTRSDGRLFFLKGVGDGTFAEAQNRSSDFADVNGTVRAGDINGDGILDAVGTYSNLFGADGDGRFIVWLGNSAGLMKPRVYSLPAPHGAFSLADLNGDGRLDIATASTAANEIDVYFGNGDGTFATDAVRVGAVASPGSIALADYDGDGRIDVIVGSRTANAIQLLENRTAPVRRRAVRSR